MIHLTDDILLAYVRRQQRNLWTAQMQEHLDLCPVCRGRCAEFKMTGDVLEAWIHSSSAVDPLYATIPNRVMRTLYEPKVAPIGRMRSGISRVRVVLPIAVVVVLLFAILLVGLQAYRTENAASPNPNKAPLKHYIVVRPQPTAKPSKPMPTAGPTGPTVTPTFTEPVATTTAVSGAGDPTTTSTPQSGPSIEVNSPCTTVIDVVEDQLHVCGTHFTSGTTVTIYYHIGTTSKKHTAQVGADGTFNDMLYIQSCNDVPGSVYVQNSTNPSETAQIAKNITFGTCQGFGGLKKPKK